MSKPLLRELSSAPCVDRSPGVATVTACWSPLAEGEHRAVCTTSDVVGVVPPHMHAQHHVGVVERGGATLLSEGRHWTLRSGDVIWHPPRQIHSLSSEYCRCRWIALDEHFVQGVVAACGMAVPEQTRVFTGGSRAAQFVELHRRLERGAITQSATSLLADLIAVVAGVPANSAVLSPLTPELERCRLAIRSSYPDNLRLVDLTRIAGMSLFHLVRSFAHAIGVPPHTYLLHLRVAWALTLLRRGLAGGRAAYEVGFSDQSHCIRVHRRLLGVSPCAVLSVERELPVMADAFARLPNTARRAAALIWRP